MGRCALRIDVHGARDVLRRGMRPRVAAIARLVVEELELGRVLESCGGDLGGNVEMHGLRHAALELPEGVSGVFRVLVSGRWALPVLLQSFGCRLLIAKLDAGFGVFRRRLTCCSRPRAAASAPRWRRRDPWGSHNHPAIGGPTTRAPMMTRPPARTRRNQRAEKMLGRRRRMRWETSPLSALMEIPIPARSWLAYVSTRSRPARSFGRLTAGRPSGPAGAAGAGTAGPRPPDRRPPGAH